MAHLNEPNSVVHYMEVVSGEPSIKSHICSSKLAIEIPGNGQGDKSSGTTVDMDGCDLQWLAAS